MKIYLRPGFLYGVHFTWLGTFNETRRDAHNLYVSQLDNITP